MTTFTVQPLTTTEIINATLQVVIANFQDPNTTPSFDNYSENDIKDAFKLVDNVRRTVSKELGVSLTKM